VNARIRVVLAFAVGHSAHGTARSGTMTAVQQEKHVIQTAVLSAISAVPLLRMLTRLPPLQVFHGS
jgi:hypothetical protein